MGGELYVFCMDLGKKVELDEWMSLTANLRFAESNSAHVVRASGNKPIKGFANSFVSITSGKSSSDGPFGWLAVGPILLSHPRTLS